MAALGEGPTRQEVSRRWPVHPHTCPQRAETHNPPSAGSSGRPDMTLTHPPDSWFGDSGTPQIRGHGALPGMALDGTFLSGLFRVNLRAFTLWW